MLSRTSRSSAQINNMVQVIETNVEVLVNGKPVKQLGHDGRIFVEAKDGSEYEVKLKNDSYSRVLAVVSIDGINAISGEEAKENDEVGYVIDARSSYTLKGFRVSDDKVNQFVFSKKEKSYAAKSEATEGSTKNCGVIAVRFYAEKVKLPVYRTKIVERIVEKPIYVPYERPWRRPYPYPYFGDDVWCSTSVTCNSASAIDNVGGTLSFSGGRNNVMRSMSASKGGDSAPLQAFLNQVQSQPVEGKLIPDFDMGTEFSDKEVDDKVTHVEFKKDRLIYDYQIFYASRAVLESFGVVFDKKPSVSFPQAFQPAGYCKSPKA